MKKQELKELRHQIYELVKKDYQPYDDFIENKLTKDEFVEKHNSFFKLCERLPESDKFLIESETELMEIVETVSYPETDVSNLIKAYKKANELNKNVRFYIIWFCLDNKISNDFDNYVFVDDLNFNDYSEKEMRDYFSLYFLPD